MTKPRVLIPMILLLALMVFVPRINQNSTPDTETLQIEEKWLVTWGGGAYESRARTS